MRFWLLTILLIGGLCSVVYAAPGTIRIEANPPVVVWGENISFRVTTALPIRSAFIKLTEDAQLSDPTHYTALNRDPGGFSNTIRLPKDLTPGYHTLFVTFVIQKGQENIFELIQQIIRSLLGAKVTQDDQSWIVIQPFKILILSPAEVQAIQTYYDPENVRAGDKVRLMLVLPFAAKGVFVDTPWGRQKDLAEVSPGRYQADMTIPPRVEPGNRAFVFGVYAKDIQQERPFLVREFIPIAERVTLEQDPVSTPQSTPVPKSSTFNIPEKIKLIEPGVVIPIDKNGKLVTNNIKPKNYLNVHGNKTITMQSKTLKGTNTSFIPGSSREESLRAEVDGQQEGINIKANIFSTTAQNVDKQESIYAKLWTPTWSVELGDFNHTHKKNSFGMNNAYITGFRLGYLWNDNLFTVLSSIPQGKKKQEYIYGNDTLGPYRLQKVPVVVNSEEVKLDGVPMVRNIDYTINYKTGDITFKNKIVQTKSVVQVNYQFSDFLYERSIFSLGIEKATTGNFDYSVMYLGQEDSLANAQAIQSSSGVSPLSAKQVDSAFNWRLNENLKIQTELALQQVNNNTLSPTSNPQSPAAFKFGTQYETDQTNIQLQTKKIDKSFSPIGNSTIHPDYEKIENHNKHNWSDDQKIQTDYENEFFTESGQYNLNHSGFFNYQMPMFGWQSSWTYKDEIHQLQNVASGNFSTNREVRNSEAKFTKDFDAHHIFVKAGTERIDDTQQAVTVQDSGLAGVGWNYNAPGLEAALDYTAQNMQRQTVTGPTNNLTSFQSNGLLNLYTEDRKHRVQSKYSYKGDSLLGDSSVADLLYETNPWKPFKSRGNYTLETLQQDFNGVQRKANKHTASLYNLFQPFQELEFLYQIRPQNTYLAEGQKLAESNQLFNTNTKYRPWQNMLLTYDWRLNMLNVKDRSDPLLLRDLNANNTNANLVSAKYAINKNWEIETSYEVQDQNGAQNSLNASGNVNSNLQNGQTTTSKLSSKLFFARAFNFTTEYQHQEQLQNNSMNSTANINNFSNQLTLKTEHFLTEEWSWELLFSGSETINKIATANARTYTLKPGIGTVFRNQQFRAEARYQYAQSYLGSNASVGTTILRFQYQPNQYLLFTINYTGEVAMNPYYETQDLFTQASVTF